MNTVKIKAVHCPHCGAGKQIVTREGEDLQIDFKCEECGKEFNIKDFGSK